MKHNIGIAVLIRFSLIIAVVAASLSSAIQPAAAAENNHYPFRILLGTYVQGYLNQETVDKELLAFDDWSGKPVSLVGMMSDMEAPGQLAAQLNALWDNGYTPFINLNFGYVSKPAAAEIASGTYDAAILKWAADYAEWAGSDKHAFIALLPEMNVPWISYGDNAEQYILAYKHIQSIFHQQSVAVSSVRWVFAPNGWSHYPYEKYYPGQDAVDVVGFSSFNFGYCPLSTNADDQAWDSPELVFGPFIRDMHKLAPSKPIFITRTGTSAYTSPKQTSTEAKNEWLRQAYDYLSTQSAVRAVLYFNYEASWECDWAVFKQGEKQYDGYAQGVANSDFSYLGPASLSAVSFEEESVNITNGIYLPLLVRNNTTTNNENAVVLGVYPGEWPGTHRVLRRQANDLGAWAGKPLSIVGTFVDTMADPKVFIELQLETIADNGYTPFVNLGLLKNSGISAKDIADGTIDANIHAVARAFYYYSQKGTRMAYVAPLQEMNQSAAAVSYGGDPENFKLAYRRFQQIFAEEGVPDQSIVWVFAPNGSSSPGDPDFEAYYPGDQYVEVVGLSAYHYGYCSSGDPSWLSWQTPQVNIGTYLERIREMAPTKSIFLSQMATSSFTRPGVKNENSKNVWLSDAYEYVSNFPNVRGIIYFNWDLECDWAFYRPGGVSNTAFQQLSQKPIFKYILPAELLQVYAQQP